MRPPRTQCPCLQGRYPASPEAHPSTSSIALTEAFGGPGSAQKSSSETEKPEGLLPRAGAESTSPAGLTSSWHAQPEPTPVPVRRAPLTGGQPVISVFSSGQRTGGLGPC